VSHPDSRIVDVILAARQVLSNRAVIQDAVGVEASLVLELPIPEPTGTFKPSRLPVTAFISQALENGVPETQPLRDAFAKAVPVLPWKYNYEPRADLPDLGLRMAWAEIIRPEAPYVSNQFCFGFTLIAPESLYPAHFHPATELYYVLSGTAQWVLSGTKTRYQSGSFILHPSNAVHAMQTSDEPLLAMYTWSGEDVVTLSKYA
jgi:mannose-6-phosphate isomerase-like protein (cupin superfamily)